VVGTIPWTVLDHPHANVPALDGTPEGNAGCAGVLRRLDLTPVGRHEGHILDAHAQLLERFLPVTGASLFASRASIHVPFCFIWIENVQ
jgi:hypothetical protein